MHPSFLSLFSFSSKPLQMCSLNSWNADQVDEKVFPIVMVSWKFTLNRVVHTTPYHHSFLQLSENNVFCQHVFFHFFIQTSHSLFSKTLVFVCSSSLRFFFQTLPHSLLLVQQASIVCGVCTNQYYSFVFLFHSALLSIIFIPLFLPCLFK